MKKFLCLVSLAVSFGAQAEAWGLKADLIPLGMKFRKVAEDDVNPTALSLRTHIEVKNIGNLAVVPGSGPTTVAIGSQILRGYVYGPSSRGGRLGDKLFPGEVGLIALSLPLGTLGHCRSYVVHIDRSRQLQKGDASVYANDIKRLTAIEPGNIRACLVPPVVK